MVPDWHKAFVSAAETIVGSGCANVGYAIGFDSWEYPIWAMLKNRGFAGSLHSIEDSGQPNDGSLLRAMQPCAVLVMGMDAPAEVLRTMGRAQPNAPIPIYSPMWPQTKAEPKPPQPVSVTPASGTGRHQVFVFKVKNLAGASDLAGTALLIGSSVGASGSCYILYDGVGGGMDLATDSGRWTKFRPVGRATVLKNSQCRVDLSKSSVQSQGLELMVSVDVTFDGRFAGAKQLYVYTSTRAGLSDSWHEMGSWVVP
jgi:hypothetical protein